MSKKQRDFVHLLMRNTFLVNGEKRHLVFSLVGASMWVNQIAFSGYIWMDSFLLQVCPVAPFPTGPEHSLGSL